MYTSSDPAERGKWLDRTRKAGARFIRLHMTWAAVVGGSPPANPENPADSAYQNFAPFDAAIQDAAARNLDVVLMLAGAPAWAEGKKRARSAPPGTWKPNPKAFGAFAQAVATRYSGHYGLLPRVKYFQAWNEPNLSGYLNPQYHHKKPRSPAIYRRMLNAFYEGVHRAQPTANVVTAGTAPYGDRPGGNRMPPLIFWRNVLCLTPLLKGRDCPDRPHLDVLSHHPIDTVGGPWGSAFGPNNVSTADFHLVRKTLRAAERHHTVRPKGRHRLWATEMWWESRPPDKAEGVALKKHARWLAAAARSLRHQGAQAVFNFLIRDVKTARANRFGTTASGIFRYGGKPKPAFRAWRTVSR